MTTRLTIEYDGTEFRGWAKQPGQRTVQEELEKALAVVRREPTTLTVAGRTDAGVHAWAQVASHPGEPAPAHRLNGLLPGDVTVLASEAASDAFDARADATARTYCYRVWNRRERPALLRDRVLHFSYSLDQDALAEAAAALLGEHDFRAFTLSDEPYNSYRRRITRAEWVRRERLLEFWISGDSFTRRMVRSLVSFQLDVARGTRTLEDFNQLLEGAPRSAGGATAPACGLYLADVSYERS
jgi:tRNA pseudouridine38-40 synthase